VRVDGTVDERVAGAHALALLHVDVHGARDAVLVAGALVGRHETAVPLDDWIDIGVLAAGATKKADGRPLILEKRHITSSPSTFELVVGEKPATAGIDPLNKLIDRNPDDNTKAAGL
jgi:hypothetical protein